ncbi:MAG: inositol monophosphatase family protein [Nitriliruptoraceae bacterium]
MNPLRWREFANALADVADAITTAAFRSSFRVDTKSDGTWVTNIDRDVEQALRQQIADEFPEHAVLGEEDGRIGDPSAPTWIIDPIDGTTNFVKGNPIFATLIALQVEGVEVAAAVSAPALSSRWDAAKGWPSRQSGREIQVSSVASLDAAEVSFGGWRYFADNGLADNLNQLAGATARQRGYGDFWQHCLVASGSTDIAVEADVNIWDLAAVKAVVEGAGGTFTSLDGEATAAGGSAISTNGLLHEDVLAVMQARA